MTTTTKSLEQKIQAAVKQLVREHLADCEAAATAAVRGAFQRVSSPSPKPSRTRSARARQPSQPRSSEELAELAARLYDAIRRHPGETMAVIAPAVGVTGRALERPMKRLRQQGRIRSAGQRRYMRYFPMGE